MFQFATVEIEDNESMQHCSLLLIIMMLDDYIRLPSMCVR